MLDPDDRHARVPYGLDEVDQRQAFVLGEATGDLVEQQQLWTRRQRACEFEPLAVEEGEGAGAGVGAVSEAALVQDVHAIAVDIALPPAATERCGDHKI